MNEKERWQQIAIHALSHENVWTVTSNDGDVVVVLNRADPKFDQELCIPRKNRSKETWLALWPIGSVCDSVETLRFIRIWLSKPMPGSVVVFDSKSFPHDELPETVHVVPSLHITRPILRRAKFESPFEIAGYFERDVVGPVEDFVGQLRWDENGRVIDARFENPEMQEEATQRKIEDRPKIVYWHDNDPDGGIQLKAMSAAAGE